jgi:hypothetical protein
LVFESKFDSGVTLDIELVGHVWFLLTINYHCPELIAINLLTIVIFDEPFPLGECTFADGTPLCCEIVDCCYRTR